MAYKQQTTNEAQHCILSNGEQNM